MTLLFTRVLPIALLIGVAFAWTQADTVAGWLRIVDRQLDALLLMIALMALFLLVTSRNAHRNLDPEAKPAKPHETFEERLAREEQMSGKQRDRRVAGD